MKYTRLLITLAMLLLTGCNLGLASRPTSTPLLFATATTNSGQAATQSPTPAPNVVTATAIAATAVAQPTTAQAASPAAATALPSATATSAPAQGNAPTLTPASPDSFPYLDDHSTATGLINSLFNAVNRKEYVRAYSYWAASSAPGGVAPFAQFQQGYANTQMVQVTLGPVGHDEGAGQIYFSIAALLKATQTNGTTQTYAACYNLHLANPIIQSVPPFVPLRIDDAKASLAASGANDADLLAHACDATGRATQPLSPAPVTNPQDITAANYLDDRTGPVEVLSSLFNAVNRHEFARAYSYWENAGTSSAVPSFDKFQQGYADTASVKLTTGTPVADNGAGQIYYSLPVVLVAQTTGGATQTFSGCYRFHLSRPEIQGVPPFMPLAIMSATVKTAANDADQAALLKQGCAGQ